MISGGDKARITEAIRDVEARSAGEVFCVIARYSSDYRLVPIVWSAFVALCVPAVLLVSVHWPARWIYLVQIGVFLVGSVILSHRALRFRLVPRRALADRVHAEAMRQFYAQGLDRTEGRTGVLIFASEGERHAEIVADIGIAAKVSPEVWDKAVDLLVSEIRAGRPGEGFVAAIEACGTVLAEHFPPGALKPDELPDKLVEI